MSIISLFTNSAPSLIVGGDVITFDAVIEDTLEAEVQYPEFPLEFGASATDHGIIMPIKWTLTAAVSNNPLNIGLTEVGAFVANLADSATLNAVAGLSAGILAGSNETRAGATLQALLALMFRREPFDIDAVDIQLQNIVIVNISRTKTATNEGGLEFVAEMTELPLISTVISANQPGQSDLREGDPAKTQVTSQVNKGEVGAITASTADISEIGAIP